MDPTRGLAHRLLSVLFVPFVLFVPALPAPARANPVMDLAFHARQVPGTRHLQLTYYDLGTPKPQVTEYMRDGEVYAAKWKPLAEASEDLGSGVVRFSATQACDCDVPVGRHVVWVTAGQRAGGPLRRSDSFEVLPEKEPSWWREYRFQGLDCRVECKAGGALRKVPQPKRPSLDRSTTFSRGFVVEAGRYVRPPYKVELSGLEVKVNGVAWSHFEPGESPDELVAAYDRVVRAFQNDCFELRCSDGLGTSKWYVTPDKRAAMLATIDDIVASKAPREEKLRRLRAEKALDGLFDGCAEQVLERWDGSR